TTSDLTSAGDTFRVSNGLITPTIDPAPTSANHTWDFSNLQWVTQQVDSFVTVGNTGAIYSLVFSNIIINPYRSNQAVIGPDLPSLPQLSITDVYYFYYNSSNAYDIKGYGANLNGLQTPLPFNNLDRVLDFPVNFGNTDSSDSDYDLSVPGLGGYYHQQHRVNNVDGWGTLITPFGTFNTLRVKSVITGRDSLDLDTLGGFGLDLPPTTEYKWYGQNKGIPLLQINTTNTFGFETVTSIVYRDSVRNFPSAISEQAEAPFSCNLFPNPAGDHFSLNLNCKQVANARIGIYDIKGRKVCDLFNGQLQAGNSRLLFKTSDYALAKGLYLLEINFPDKQMMLKLVVQ
ncbi:MAG TPA: T9SS type A sorting domain-containing protein, partial [Bacteroidia bacterium]|nr:T9SS type A sorting domain-containing protein [Bacteroidia bacterium]